MAENKPTAKKTGKLAKFFKETKAELKKVTWPTKQQVIHNTIIILIFIVIVTAILSLLDFGFEKLLSAVITR